jgi:hypothetical protein
MTRGPGTGFNGNELYEPDLSDGIELENTGLGFLGFLDPDALARLEDNKVPAFTVSYQTSIFASSFACVTL